MVNRAIAIVIACVLALFSVRADDESQSELRLNPEIEQESDESTYDYGFLDMEANKICMNGADWSALRERYAGSCDTGEVFSVVYLGDSHVQADFGGAVLRRRLSEVPGSAGRGIVIPFKLAGTNEPNDYSVRMQPRYLSAKLMKQPWEVEMPFTGIGLKPLASECCVEISCAEQPFSEVRLHYRGERPEVLRVEDCEGNKLPFEYCDSTLWFDQSVSDVKVCFESAERTVFGGFELWTKGGGVLVHSVGNNGATYSSYGAIDNFGNRLSALQPDLVIIALGTNEAFGRFDEGVMRQSIGRLVDEVKAANPESQILMVSPAECLRKVYRRVKGRRRRVAATVVNDNVAQVRDVIKDYAQSHGIAFYDSYAVAGGSGAAEKMKREKVLGSDGVHYNAEGYRLWGSLLGDAVLCEMGCW